MTTLKTYEGHCHCGAVQFRFTSPIVTVGGRCNCSICVRKGAVMSARVDAADFELLSGSEALSVYRFGDRDVDHYFCGICGVFPFHEAPTAPRHYRANLGCVDSIDTLDLEIEITDGRSF